MDGKRLDKPEELVDKDLGGVAGGRTYAQEAGKYYKYVGTKSDADWNNSYVCPHCDEPVAYKGWGRYYCKDCDESWWDERKLDLNFESGVWKEITKQEYNFEYNAFNS